MSFFRSTAVLVALIVASSLLSGVGAQEMQGLPQASELAGQSLRPYWHVFIAYALAIVLIGGWAVSIGRRLRDVENRLVD